MSPASCANLADLAVGQFSRQINYPERDPYKQAPTIPY